MKTLVSIEFTMHAIRCNERIHPIAIALVEPVHVVDGPTLLVVGKRRVEELLPDVRVHAAVGDLERAVVSMRGLVGLFLVGLHLRRIGEDANSKKANTECRRRAVYPPS